MKPLLINLGVVFGTLIITGALLKPYKDKAVEDMRADGVLPEPMSLEKRNEIGQAGYAAALGGLRPVLASYFYLRAHNQHVERDWYEMDKTLNTIVAMQPKSEYYWDMGGWHLAYNTSSLERDNRNIDPLERERRRLLYIQRGEEFMERGIEHLPESYKLRAALVALNTDTFRAPNFERAYKNSNDHFTKSELTDNRRLLAWGNHLRIMMALDGKEVAAYESLLDLWDISNELQRVPSIRVARYVLEDRLELPHSQRMHDEVLFMDPNHVRNLFGVHKFLMKTELSDKPALLEKLKGLYKKWNSTVPCRRNVSLKVQIKGLENRLETLGARGEGIPEENFYFDDAEKAYIEKMATLPKFFKAIEGKEKEALDRLRKVYTSGKATRFQKTLLLMLQSALRDEVPVMERIPSYVLGYDPIMKYDMLFHYWQSVNNMRLGIFSRNIKGMQFRPTQNLLKEIREFEEIYRVSEKWKVKPSDIYTPEVN